jgi:hypothetical protein
VHAVIHKLKVKKLHCLKAHSFQLPNQRAVVIMRNADSAGTFGCTILFGCIIMSGREQRPYDSVARRWLALIERRQENIIDLCNSGRWRHYYSKAEFLDEMRKVLRLRDQWAVLAGLPEQGEDFDFLRNFQTPHRVLPDRLVRLSLTPNGELEDEADLLPERRRANGVSTPRWPD